MIELVEGERGIEFAVLLIVRLHWWHRRFGTLYDKRNFPRLEVNQYEQSDPKRFPWGLRMPVAGALHAELTQR